MDMKLEMHLDSSANLNQALRFAGDVHSCPTDGFDDPIFLEESWTLGPAAAAMNLRSRRHAKADRKNRARALRELDNVGIGALRFIEDRERAAESALVDRAATIVDLYDANTTKSWAPRDWIPEDRITQSWIPRGWTPSYMPRFEPMPVTELCDGTMSSQRARLLLEVTAASTREEVRSAYRRMVGQWHPDRLQYTTEAIRKYATEHMAALNEAYRLLCSAEMQEAA